MFKCYLISVAFLFLSTQSFCQQFSLQGSAIQTGPVTYRLTPDVGNQAGMATNYYPFDLTTNFTLNFQLNFGTKDVTGADGIAFMLSNTCNPTLVNGQGLGVANTPNSLVVDFDTWDNGVGYNDLPDDHSGIYANGNFSVAGNIMDGTTVPVCLTPACANVEDGLWYDVAIQWEYLGATSQKISVYFNGVLLSTSTQNHIANRFNNNSTVFWSLAASTGGSSNLQQFRVLSSNNTYTFCPGETFTLTAPALGTNYSWTSNSSTTNTATYTATTSATYTCTFTNFCNLAQTVSFTINVTQLLPPTLSNNGPVCSGSDGIFTITGVPGYTVSYAVNNGAVQTLNIGPGGTALLTINGITAPQFLLLSSITDGVCTKTINVEDTIRLKQLTTPVISNNGPVCSGTDAVFTLSGTPGYIVSYSVNGAAVQQVTVNGSGTVTVTVPAATTTQDILLSMVDDGSSCTQAINVTDTIRIKPPPLTPSVSNNGPLCPASDAIFMISGTAGDQLTYNLNGGIDQSVIIDAAGNAQVMIPSISTAQSMTITSVLSNSCIAPNNVNSFIAILPSTTSVVDTTICDGLNYFGHYQTGTYLDTFPASVGCDSIRTLHLIVIKTPKPNLGPDKVICPGESFPISPGNFSTYLWQDGTTQPVFTVTAPGIYTVTVNSTCGNLADQLVVTRGICDIYFASGFTPDKNGKNDAFKVLTDLSLQEYDLKVFDRWGEIIFHTKEQGKGWDGTLKGVTLDAGLYIWISSFVYNGQKKFMKGTVMLIR